MQLTKEEIKIAVYSIIFGADGLPRKFALDDLALATDCFKALNTCVNDDEEKTYKDSTVDFSTSIKAFLMDSIKRQWGVVDGGHVLTLLKKLEE